MTGRGPVILVGAVLALAAGAAAALAAGSNPAGESAGRGREFQHLVGGLGFGAAADMSGCAEAFDPRLESACARRAEPLPATRGACLLHAGSLLFASDRPAPAGRSR